MAAHGRSSLWRLRSDSRRVFERQRAGHQPLTELDDDGCEVTAGSNCLLGRNDQVGYILLPIDAAGASRVSKASDS